MATRFPLVRIGGFTKELPSGDTLDSSLIGVTSFSAGDLSPLFTTTETNPTTTPALTFALVNQNANIVYAGPGSGSAAAPTFRALVANDLPFLQNKHQIELNNADYTNTAGANSHILMTNANSGGQNVVMSRINGTDVAKWRTDSAGSVNWVAYSGNHTFYTGGDYPTGTPKFKITAAGQAIFTAGHTNPISKVDIDGNLTIGATYAGTNAAPTNGLLVQGNIGVGATSPSAKFHLISTTEQMRLGYDTGNYLKCTVGSTGTVVWDAVGSSAKHQFLDNVEVSGDVISEDDFFPGVGDGIVFTSPDGLTQKKLTIDNAGSPVWT